MPASAGMTWYIAFTTVSGGFENSGVYLFKRSELFKKVLMNMEADVKDYSKRGLMHFFFLSCFFIICFQPRPVMARVYNGDLFLDEQAKVDSLGDLTQVNGDLLVHRLDITNLDSLHHLTSISGMLIIDNCLNLTNLDGLSSLETVSGDAIIDGTALANIDGLSSLQSTDLLSIRYNPNLTTIDGLAQLTSAEVIYLEDNSALASLDGFANLTSINELTIKRNSALLSINGFAALQSASHCYIENNTALTNINGFGAVESVENLRISSNPSLTDISGFGSLETIENHLTIENNAQLGTLNGFPALRSVGNIIKIKNNTVLSDISGFGGLQQVGDLIVENNAALPVLDGFDALLSCSHLEILDNPQLSTIRGFKNLQQVDDHILIENCTNLLTLGGFASLSHFQGALSIRNNAGLSSIEGFPMLRSVGELVISDNATLTNLDAFMNLHTALEIRIANNTQLTQFCGLVDVSANSPDDMVWDVFDNADNPSRDAVLVSCSGTITATVFFDQDGDGARHKNEPGLAEVTVRIDNDLEDKTTKRVTGLDGCCHFHSPAPGHACTMEIEENTLPPGFAYTTAQQIALDGNQVQNSQLSDIYFGLQFSDTTLVEKYNENAATDEPTSLVFIEGSPSFIKEPWSNLVDSDLEGWDGTATVKADENGHVWAVFGFADGAAMFDKATLFLDNGTDDDAYEGRQPDRVDLFVSNSGLSGTDFAFFGHAYVNNARTASVELGVPVTAKYLKITAPNVSDGAWKQLVEMVLSCAGREGAIPATKSVSVAELPSTYVLGQNYPNPFNPITTISYTLPETQNVDITIYNIKGDLVKQLVSSRQDAGVYNVNWDATANNGHKVTTGIYFYRLRAGEFEEMKKMTLVQ